jgi:hypothetical protein
MQRCGNQYRSGIEQDFGRTDHSLRSCDIRARQHHELLQDRRQSGRCELAVTRPPRSSSPPPPRWSRPRPTTDCLGSTLNGDAPFATPRLGQATTISPAKSTRTAQILVLVARPGWCDPRPDHRRDRLETPERPRGSWPTRRRTPQVSGFTGGVKDRSPKRLPIDWSLPFLRLEETVGATTPAAPQNPSSAGDTPPPF